MIDDRERSINIDHIETLSVPIVHCTLWSTYLKAKFC